MYVSVVEVAKLGVNLKKNLMSNMYMAHWTKKRELGLRNVLQNTLIKNRLNLLSFILKKEKDSTLVFSLCLAYVPKPSVLHN